VHLVVGHEIVFLGLKVRPARGLSRERAHGARPGPEVDDEQDLLAAVQTREFEVTAARGGAEVVREHVAERGHALIARSLKLPRRSRDGRK